MAKMYYAQDCDLNRLNGKNILCTSELGSINIKFSNASQKVSIYTSSKN